MSAETECAGSEGVNAVELTHGSLFSGVGGTCLAIEGAYGAETIWHVEYDKFDLGIVCPSSQRRGEPVREPEGVVPMTPTAVP